MINNIENIDKFKLEKIQNHEAQKKSSRKASYVNFRVDIKQRQSENRQNNKFNLKIVFFSLYFSFYFDSSVFTMMAVIHFFG